MKAFMLRRWQYLRYPVLFLGYTWWYFILAVCMLLVWPAVLLYQFCSKQLPAGSKSSQPPPAFPTPHTGNYVH